MQLCLFIFLLFNIFLVVVFQKLGNQEVAEKEYAKLYLFREEYAATTI